ncbi:MAG: deoxynucleoside kinase [Anaerolineaceae bacterium]|nr:deoxynucleoside kinase [Anaerolineaceae bacterium]
MKRFVSVAGNIGVGKSTLVRLISESLGWVPFYEPVVENPYLADFYEDMNRWGFNSQIFFLSHRLRIHHQIARSTGSVVLDRSIYEDAEVFARNLYLNRHMSERDYNTYRALYETMSDVIEPPDLMIYLKASVPTLQQRVAKRDRSYERTIPDAYLDQLNGLYEEWISRFKYCPVLTVPADDLDYVAHPQHLKLIVTKIQEKLMGVEEVVFDLSGIEPL